MLSLITRTDFRGYSFTIITLASPKSWMSQNYTGVDTLSLPALEDVGLIGIKETSSIGRSASFWKGLCDKEPMHRLPRHLQAARNFPLGEGLLMENSDSLITRRPIGAAHL